MPGGINSGIIGSTTQAPAQLQLALPEPISQEIQQPYILNGLTYKSNNPYIIDRDDVGNIKLQESASNQRLIIEPSIENITNQSFVEVVDTQFKYFKFPVKVNATGASELDIDLPDFTLDRYEGRLIKVKGGTFYFIENGIKRLFYIRADSTWAIKNNLPPFANIAGNISGKEIGGDNYTNYADVTYDIVPISVLASYEEGSAYTWIDAFPEEEDRYSKFHYNVNTFDSLGGTNIYINGPDFSPAEFSITALSTHQPGMRYSEFNTDDTKDSYLGFNVNTPGVSTYTWGLDYSVANVHIYKTDVDTDDDWYYYLMSTRIKAEGIGGTNMKVKMDVNGVDHNMTPFLVDGFGNKSGTATVTFPAPSGGDYGGWVLRIPELIERLKTKNPNKIVTLSNGNEQIKGNVGIRFNLQFPETNYDDTKTREVYFEFRIGKDNNTDDFEVVDGNFHTSWYGGVSNRTYTDVDSNWNAANNANGWGWGNHIVAALNASLVDYPV